MRRPISTTDWLVSLHKSPHSIGAECSVAEQVRGRTGRKAAGPSSPTVDRQGWRLFVDKAQKTQSPRGPDPRWPSLFERILAVEEGEGAHSEPLAFVWVYTTGNFAKFYDLEEFPYDFPETLHASPYWLVMKKCRRQLFPNWTGCGDRCKKRLFLTPKKRQFWGKSAISFERLVLAAQVRMALL